MAELVVLLREVRLAQLPCLSLLVLWRKDMVYGVCSLCEYTICLRAGIDVDTSSSLVAVMGTMLLLWGLVPKPDKRMD